MFLRKFCQFCYFRYSFCCRKEFLRFLLRVVNSRSQWDSWSFKIFRWVLDLTFAGSMRLNGYSVLITSISFISLKRLTYIWPWIYLITKEFPALWVFLGPHISYLRCLDSEYISVILTAYLAILLNNISSYEQADSFMKVKFR